MPEHVSIVEVGARDGLQNITTFVPTAQKIALIDLLSACGFSEIEAASFVSPKWVPQMADGAQVMAGIRRAPGIRYTALTPNARGFSEALDADVDAVSIFVSASEGFSKENINKGVEESLQQLMPVVENAFAANMRVRGYISCVTDCPFDGPVAPEAVARVAEALSGMGCAEISLGDTIGQGTPSTIAAMLDAVLAVVPAARLAGHFHATNGRALDNIDVALSHGLRVFDSAIAGLGGCPFAPGAEGNLATGDLYNRLETLGFETGLDPVALARASRFAQRLKGTA